MFDLVRSVEFWVAMIFAVFVKVRASKKITVLGAAFTIATAVLSALVFTGPLLDWLDLSGETYVAAVAALVALSAEHIARQLMETRVVDLIRAWRGK